MTESTGRSDAAERDLRLSNRKSQAEFRTISEVADELDVAQHVLRFWESKFPQVRPLKRGGGRRYYRPKDVDLLREIRSLLYDEGYTIKAAQNLLTQRRGTRVSAALKRVRNKSDELRSTLYEGQILNGVIKNITDNGAFVDLNGIEGFLHVTNISWKSVNQPADVLSVRQHVKVQVIHINSETQRISLGMKQLEADPWEGVELRYQVGTKFKGTITNITDYGAFVELEPGIEGLVQVSEMSSTQKNVHPGEIVSPCQDVEVIILEVDPDTRRIDLSMRQLAEDDADGDKMVELDMSAISDEEWLSANLIALQNEAVERSKSLDKTLSYVKKICYKIAER